MHTLRPKFTRKKIIWQGMALFFNYLCLYSGRIPVNVLVFCTNNRVFQKACTAFMPWVYWLTQYLTRVLPLLCKHILDTETCFLLYGNLLIHLKEAAKNSWREAVRKSPQTQQGRKIRGVQNRRKPTDTSVLSWAGLRISEAWELLLDPLIPRTFYSDPAWWDPVLRGCLQVRAGHPTARRKGWICPVLCLSWLHHERVSIRWKAGCRQSSGGDKFRGLVLMLTGF